MFRNYYRIALRNVRKNLVNNFISIFGLAIGIGCCLLVFLYAKDEFSYDLFHKNKSQLYRVIKPYYEVDGSTVGVNLGVDPALAVALYNYFPEVISQTQWRGTNLYVKHDTQIFLQQTSIVSSTFFDMFSFPLIDGNYSTVLEEKYNLVITETTSQKYFGSDNPIGKTLQLNVGNDYREYVVTGLAKDPPANSSLQFQFLINIENYPLIRGNPNVLSEKGNDEIQTFIRLSVGSSSASVRNRLAAFCKEHYAALFANWDWEGKIDPFGLDLQSVTDMHFNEATSVNNGYKSLKNSIITLSLIAFVILLISIFNYINLSIGMATNRAKEIGVRKVVGAGKFQLIFQFWSEATLLVSMGLTFGILLGILFLPIFNEFTGKHLFIGQIFTFSNVIALVLFVLVIGIISGLYPGFIMSRLNPVTILKGKIKVSKGKGVTKVLMLIQFSVAILLVTLASIADRQLLHLIQKDLGYNDEGLIAIQIPWGKPEMAVLFHNKIKQHKDVQEVAGSNFRLGLGEAGSIGGEYSIHFGAVNQDFFRTLDIEIVMGRDFRKNDIEDANAVIVDGIFMKTFGLVAIEGVDIGKLFKELDGRDAPSMLNGVKIIGVAKSFHYLPATRELRNSVFFNRPFSELRNIQIKVRSENFRELVDYLESSWKELNPDIPFSYQFQDDMTASLFNYEKRLGKMVNYISILTIIITCMGLFGLSLIMVGSRIKEIAVRKVLGARLVQVILMNLKGIILIVFVANVLAIPFTYYFGEQFLQDYSSRINIGIYSTLFAIIFSVLISVLTSIYNVFKVAKANPINHLRNE